MKLLAKLYDWIVFGPEPKHCKQLHDATYLSPNPKMTPDTWMSKALRPTTLYEIRDLSHIDPARSFVVDGDRMQIISDTGFTIAL